MNQIKSRVGNRYPKSKEIIDLHSSPKSKKIIGFDGSLKK